MLILKSFFRKRNTRIYLIILCSLISIIFCLHSIINYVSFLINKNYVESHLLFMQYDTNYEKQLASNADLQNINRVLTFDDIEIEGLQKIILNEFDIGKIMAYSSSEKKQTLKNDEIVIFLDQINYINYEKKIKNVVNSRAILRINEQEIKLRVKEIVKEKRRNGIIISNDLFEKLVEQGNYIYVANVKDYKKINETINELKKEKNSNVIVLDNSNSEESKSQEKMQQILKYVTNASHILLIMFFLIIIIVNKNIIEDSKSDSLMKYKIGYTDFQIKKYLLFELLSIQIISIIIGLIILAIFIILAKTCCNFELLFSVKYIILNILILLLSVDFLLIIVNHKFLPRKVVIK